MFYKFIKQNQIEPFKGYVKVAKTIIANPPEADILAAGFKPLADSGQPYYNPETQYIIQNYIDGEQITVNYTVMNLTNEEVTES